MFKCIASFFRMLDNLFQSGETITRVGKKYADVFEAKADRDLAAQRAELDAQVRLSTAA